MGKNIQTPTPVETVTIPRASFDALFTTLEEMKREIAMLRKEIPEHEDKLFSRAEAADYCKVSVWTLNNYRKAGMVTKVLRGCRSGYLKSDLDKVRKAERSRSHKKNPR